MNDVNWHVILCEYDYVGKRESKQRRLLRSNGEIEGESKITFCLSKAIKSNQDKNVITCGQQSTTTAKICYRKSHIKRVLAEKTKNIYVSEIACAGKSDEA